TGNSFLCRDEHARDLEALRESDALNHHPARENSGGWRAGQPQSSARQPTHTFRIADAHAIGAHVDVIAQWSLRVIHGAGKVERPSAGFGAYVFKVDRKSVV